MNTPTALRSVVAGIAAVGVAVAMPHLTAASGRAPARVIAPAVAPAPPQEFAPGDAAFFEVPDPVPAGAHGDLIRWQVVPTTFDVFYRIMYLSETVGGRPTVVTGIVTAPDDSAPVGGFPLLLHGHGGVGLADQCAPSRAVDAADTSYSEEFQSIGSTAVNDGFVVVSTDYEGIGGPGHHPFLVGVSEGRSMLDAGLAARQLPVLYVGADTAILGFSQGGHAALWATQIAADWTPQQPIVGTVAVAASSELAQLVGVGVDDPAKGFQAVAVLAGLAASYPEAAAALPLVLTPAGAELVGLLDEHCFAELERDVPLPTPPFLAIDPTTVEPYASLIAANTPGSVTTLPPILLFHGDGDENVPLATSDELLARLCGLGQVVERRVLPGANHVVSESQSRQPALEWIVGLLGGSQPISSCR